MIKPNFNNIRKVTKENNFMIDVDQLEEDWDNFENSESNDRKKKHEKRYKKGGPRRTN
jgi:hypothetical protein